MRPRAAATVGGRAAADANAMLPERYERRATLLRKPVLGFESGVHRSATSPWPLTRAEGTRRATAPRLTSSGPWRRTGSESGADERGPAGPNYDAARRE